MKINMHLSATERIDLANHIADKLQLQTSVSKDAIFFVLDNLKLLDNKQLDYGPHNISQHGEVGIAIRLTDKIARVNNLLSTKRKRKNESLDDTYRDISNYAIIALLVRNGLWK